MDDTIAHDLHRLFDAIARVRHAAVLESATVRDLLATPSSEAIETLHSAHLAELDAVQAMGAAMELLMRRHPGFLDALALLGADSAGAARLLAKVSQTDD